MQAPNIIAFSVPLEIKMSAKMRRPWAVWVGDGRWAWARTWDMRKLGFEYAPSEIDLSERGFQNQTAIRPNHARVRIFSKPRVCTGVVPGPKRIAH